MGENLAAESCLKDKSYADVGNTYSLIFMFFYRGGNQRIGLGTYHGVPFRRLSPAQTPSWHTSEK